MFLCHSMFNPLTTFSFNRLKVPEIIMLITRYNLIRERSFAVVMSL